MNQLTWVFYLSTSGSFCEPAPWLSTAGKLGWRVEVSDRPARLLCMCSPPGLETFFLAVGEPVESRTALAGEVDTPGHVARMAKVKALAPRYRTELLLP